MKSKVFVTCSLLICLALLLSASVPCFAGLVNPRKVSQINWSKATAPALTASLKGTPNPGGNNVQIKNNRDLIVVYPLSKPSVSSSNAEANYVQWAIDNVNPGGTVRLMMKDLLKGINRVFDFGGRKVFVLNGIIIEGEKVSSVMGDKWTTAEAANQNFEIIEPTVKRTIKSDRAVIYNGGIQVGWMNFIPVEPYVINNPPDQDYTVRSLRFEKAKTFGIVTFGSKKLAINDNVITTVVPGPNQLFGYIEAEGIVILGAHELSEEAKVENNYVDIFGDDSAKDPMVNWTTNPYGDFDSRADGIQILGTQAGGLTKKLYIKDNYIKNAASAGIYLMSIGNTITSIERNTIKQRQFNNIYDSYGNVALLGEGISAFGNADGAQMTIASNTIEGVTGDGIGIYGLESFSPTFAAENILVKNNKVSRILFNGKAWFNTVAGTYIVSGISAGGTSKNNSIEGNVITGTGAYGIMLAQSSHNNTVVNPYNGLIGFTPATASQMQGSGWPYNTAQIFLGPSTESNTVDCGGATIIDLGTNTKNNCP